jgi:hypothetical protein
LLQHSHQSVAAGAENAADDSGEQQTILRQKVAFEQTKLNNFDRGKTMRVRGPGAKHSQPDSSGEPLSADLATQLAYHKVHLHYDTPQRCE